MVEPRFVPYDAFRERPATEMQSRARAFYELMQTRRTVRDFSERPVPAGVLEDCLLAAGTAPSGANMQPWHFVVATSPELKSQIRAAAEEEEREFYTRRAPKEWLEALAPLGTDEQKLFLETAPALIVIFAETVGRTPSGKSVKHYYVQESVGIATGVLITALHNAGLATLTHTPSPMRFLNRLLDRPDTERPFLILVTGYPAADATVPTISKRSLDELATFR